MIETEVHQSLRVHVRWMTRGDMPEVVGIEAASHEFPMSEAKVLEVLRRRNCIGMVAERQGRVLGFFLYELKRECVRIIDFAVAPEHRRLGVGGKMMDKLKSKLIPGRRTRLELTARETKTSSLLFLKDQGFKATGVIREFFEDSGEDGYAMVYDL